MEQKNTNSGQARRILRMHQVVNLTGLSKSTIYLYMIKKGTFPKARKISERSVGWDSEEIQNWINSKIGGENA